MAEETRAAASLESLRRRENNGASCTIAWAQPAVKRVKTPSSALKLLSPDQTNDGLCESASDKT
jgi:hypothetical protein